LIGGYHAITFIASVLKVTGNWKVKVSSAQSINGVASGYQVGTLSFSQIRVAVVSSTDVHDASSRSALLAGNIPVRFAIKRE